MDQTVDIRELNERIENNSSFVNMITMGMNQVIVGQKHLIESLLIGLLSDKHICTAINLTIFDLPRLSVDIDLNYSKIN